jgi:hypothetical protein
MNDSPTIEGTHAVKRQAKDSPAVPESTLKPAEGTCTSGRKYAYAYKKVADAIGVRGKIKTRYGKLCMEPTGTGTAYHVVYANVSRQGDGDQKWAQCGYGRERNAGAATIKTYRYAEMNGDAYKVNYDTGNAPTEGSIHTYECLLDKATGKWSFSCDGTVWENFSDPKWKDLTGNVAQWVGEIYNKEDDMPGTDQDKCQFTECQQRVHGKEFADASLVAGDLRTDDSTEWGAEHVSKTAFNIWDKKPLK